jgi:uncharacterized protein YecE (DUF72 family)
MRIRVGTSGWSYKEWKGHFYPEKLAAKNMQHFPSVEVNNTFYRMPNVATLAGWAAEVPDDFQFVLKASKRITHDRRLKEVADSVDYFLRTAGTLARLRDFLTLLPAGTRAAFEFRNASWFEDEVYGALREHNHAWCVADTGEEGDPPFIATADWGYLRLRKVEYGEGDLASWAERVQSQSWQEAFVFFKHEDEATGPKLATRFIDVCNARGSKADESRPT